MAELSTIFPGEVDRCLVISGKFTLNTASDNLTAVFYRKEMHGSGGIWAWYTAEGTFSDNISALLKYPSRLGTE